MRLKEIKPGMVIHCKNDDEKKALLEEAERLGYKWNSRRAPTDFRDMELTGMTIHFRDKSEYCAFMNITWSDKTEGVTEFSDLILPEPTAEEAFRICGELCKEHSFQGYGCDSKCPFAHHDMSCTFYRSQNPEKAIEILAQWKSDHEKKEPEIETVDICRIIEIQPDGRKRCVHEEDIKPDSDLPYGYERDSVNAILKRYCMEHDGEFIAVHEVVSRVKR